MDFPFPKIELHLHLDGSLVLEDAWQMAQEQKLVNSGENYAGFCGRMQVPVSCRSLAQYLECFTLADALLQSAPALERATYRLLLALQADGVVYAEIRFAPQLHQEAGLTQEQAVQAVLRGVQHAEKETRLRAGVLLCAMVQTDKPNVDAENERTFRLAAEYRNEGVVGVDLAGAETARPMTDFQSLFQLAARLGLPATIHAGEAGDAENVRLALDFGARRIGHGCAAAHDSALLERLRRENITLEVCPTSNLQTCAVPSLQQHPIRTFVRAGVPVTVSTDNRTVSGVTLSHEYELLTKLGFTLQDLARMNEAAAYAAFLPQKEKAALLQRLEPWT